MFQFFFIFTFLLFTTVLSQTTTTTSSSPSSEPDCLNPDLLLTPAFRKKILDDVNAGRNKLKNGQLLLNNGEYALVPESMPELNWSCDFEEEMHEYGRQYCETQQSPNQNWTSFTGFFNSEHAYLVNSGTHNLNYYTYPANYLSQHTIYTGFAPNNVISALHDKAEYLGCAIYDCQRDSNNENIFPSDPSYTIMNMMFCRVSPDVDFGEKVYEVSPTANANFPSQDVICGDGHGGDIEMRQIILEKINAVRQQIQQGTYILKNGYPALQAVNMPNLIYDCDEETALMGAMMGPDGSSSCLANNDPETIFQTIIPYDWQTWNENFINNAIGAYLDQLFTQNPNLNFLSQSTTYSTEYPAALVLSDQATIIACSQAICFDSGEINYNVLCRAKPSAQINDQLYQI